ncbi:hypothetical protein ALC62_05459 [Cyphomyrmex costatus]|uniref:Gustatory receptor n=1 Tax=Cyphomyrmex costatus TaxID=456900 RepID=A0A195CTC0_9HYME|nr:hypothetical protein ALC62_05459 [Cyphomyrmex costatus]
MDFESLMYPCITFCRTLGIFPYKIKAYTIKANKPCYVFSTIIICVLCLYDLTTLYNLDYEVIFNHGKNITIESEDDANPKLLEGNCFFIFGGFTCVSTFLLSGQRMRVLQEILEISSKLPQKLYQNMSVLIHTKDILGFFFVLGQMMIHYYIQKYETLRIILMLYIHLLEFQMDMMYMNCVCVLKACFKQLNESLSFFKKFEVNEEPSLLEATYPQKQKNPYQLMQLKTLMKQHQTLSNTLEMLQTTFKWQLISTTVMTFIQITFNLYFLFSQMEKNPYDYGDIRSLTIRLTKHSDLILFIINYIIKILFIVWACETGKNEAMNIKTSIHDVINNTNDEEIQSELKVFSLQLMQRDNVFCAKGITVDAMLLTAVSD